MCIPDNPSTLIIVILLIINTVLVIAYKMNCDYKKIEIKKKKAEKESHHETYNEEEFRDEIPPLHWYAWVLGICVCLDIWIIGALFTHWWAEKYFTHIVNEDNNKALFGDSFGAVNALISAFAFAGMIVAFILQRYELRLQRKELEAQRKEFEEQNNTLKLQRFENTFFHMLELQQQIVSDLYVKEVDKEWVEEDSPNPEMGRIRKQVTVERVYQGRNLFRYAFVESRHYIKYPQTHKEVEVYGLSNVMRIKGFSQYDQYYTSTYFDHYFRHFYRILKFIKQNEDWLSSDEQYRYASMLRATLSRYELVWLYYNGLSQNGCEKLKPLMERYSMLKNMRSDFLTLCKENSEKVDKSDAADKDIIDAGFTYSDYDFYLTDQIDDSKKYYLSVFYNEEEHTKGKEYYNRWTEFCRAKHIDVAE